MSSLQELIYYHIRRYEGMQPRDVYKLLFQGVFGPEHLLTNHFQAVEYLMKEWESVSADKNEELLEPVSIDGKMFRVNLRPAKAKNINLSDLWEAFLNSAKMPKPGAKKFIAQWDAFIEMCRQNIFKFDLEQLNEFDIEMKGKGYPAAHHSQTYRDENWPAYRVVLKSEILPYI